MAKENFAWAKNATTQEDVRIAQQCNLDMVSAIQCAMYDDCENDSATLIELYANATEDETAIMDAVLIAVCGEGFGSLASHAEPMEDEEED